SHIISGQFTEVNGYAYNNIAKLNPDFSVDTTFQSPFNPAGIAFTALVDGLNRIWVSALEGSTLINQEDVPVSLARLLPDGTVDSTFHIPTIFVDHEGYHNTSYAYMTEDSDRTYIVYGSMTSYNGHSVNKIAKIEDNGELIIDAFSGLGVDSHVWGSYSTYYGGRVSVVKKLSDGKLLIGGEFSSFGGEPYSCLVRLEPSGFVGIDEKEVRGKLKLYPNPAQSFITIKIPQGNDVINTVEIITVQGKVVKQIQNFRQDDKV